MLIILIVLGLMFPVFLAESQAPTLTVIQIAALDIPFVDNQDLIDADLYIRSVEDDNHLPHVLVAVSNNTYIAQIFGNPNRDYSGWSGATTERWRWNFNTNQTDIDGDRASLSVVTIFYDPAVQFGLILHELSRASGTGHGNGTQIGDANYWERIGNAAYNRQCSMTVFCLDIESIIYDD